MTTNVPRRETKTIPPQPNPDATTDRSPAANADAKRRHSEAYEAVLKLPERPEGVLIDGAFSAAHGDDNAFFAELFVLLQSRSEGFVNVSLQQLSAVTKVRGNAGRSLDLNALLAFVAAVKPKDELEGALALQMAGTHTLAMELLAKARSTDALEHLESYTGLSVKLMRTFAAQTEALAKLRSAGKQIIEVQHVHIHSGAQAVVGSVHTGGGGGAVSASVDQPLAAALGFAPGGGVSPMWGEDAPRDAMPIASGEG